MLTLDLSKCKIHESSIPRPKNTARTAWLVLPGELPDDERLVPGGREDHLGELGVGGDLRGTGLSRDRGFISESQLMFDIY